MTFTKSLLLGSAAVLVAAASAQAADLPSKKAAPAQYVKICDAAGAGYFYIPGSDTCLKISGYVEVDARGQNTKNDDKTTGGLNSAHRFSNSFDTSVDTEITLDTVTKTSYGDLTSHLAYEADVGASNSYNGNSNAYIDKAYLTFAGLTAGYVETSFNHIEGGYNHRDFNPDYSVEALRYTASFGGGFSASVALEDSTSNRQGVANNFALSGTSSSGETGALNGGRAPDVVANLAVKQGWGEAGIDGALHNASVALSSVSGTTSSSTTTYLSSSTKTGYGIGGYVKINLPTLAAGDFIGLQADYDQNAFKYSGLARSSQRFGAGATQADIAVDSTGAFHNQKGWNVIAELVHNWSPTVSTDIAGSYGENRFSNANSLSGFSAAPNYNAYGIGQVTKWTPVKGLEFGVDTTYIRYSDKATTGFTTTDNKSSDFQVDFRVIRTF